MVGTVAAAVVAAVAWIANSQQAATGTTAGPTPSGPLIARGYSEAPAGTTPTAGTIAYYAPWGNLAIFYRDFAYSRGLIPLGRIDTGLAALKSDGVLKVRIELAE